DVLGDDAALWACAPNHREVDSPLARDPPGERGRLDPPTVAVRRGRCGRLRLRYRGRLGLGLRWGRRRFFPRRLGDLRHLLPLLADDGDRPADRHFALVDSDLQQHARGLGLDLLRDLVRVELIERLTLLDALSLSLEPLDDRPRLHPLTKP